MGCAGSRDRLGLSLRTKTVKVGNLTSLRRPQDAPPLMAVKFHVPQAAPLPRPPVLAEVTQASSDDLGRNTLQGLKPGEIVHIIGSVPDGSAVYAVNTGSSPAVREGWIASSSVKPLSSQETVDAPRLPLRELLKRVTLARAEENWLGIQDPETCLPALRVGELLQLGAVRDNWAYGWYLRNPKQKGWFPLALARRLEPSASSLVSTEEGEELSANAAEALVELLRRVPQPPPQAFSANCPLELPAAVEASARSHEQQWKEKFQDIDDQKACEALAEARAAEEAAAAAAAPHKPEAIDIFPPDTIPADSYPLYVCRTAFSCTAAGTWGRAYKSLLNIEVGDLVRVVSLPDAHMYCGFREERPNFRAWFPRRCVEQLEDPLDAEADTGHVGHLGIGPPPLPVLPPGLAARNAQ